MKKYSLVALVLLMFAASTLLGCGGGNTQPNKAKTSENTVETPFGPIIMDGDIIAKQDVDKIYTELAFQQACQSYMWAIPIVSFTQWEHTQQNVFKTQNGDIVLYTGYENTLRILTANVTTPYLLTFIDMSQEGPFILDIPAGNVAGGALDMWQKEFAVFGEMGEQAGKSAKYLFLPPGTKNVDDKGYSAIFQCDMNNFFIGLRVLDPDPAKMKEIAGQIKLYPYSTRNNPRPNKVVTPPAGANYLLGQPRGMEYWQRLYDIIQKEPVQERNMFYMAMLKNLGVEKGKPFNPTESQKKALLDGAKYGELMVQALTFDKPFPNIKPWDDKHWEYVVTMDNAEQRDATHEYLMERTPLFYEAVSFSKSMLTKVPGKGQAYLGGYTDGNGAWLDGAKNYTLHVPSNPPAANFWSITLYDIGTRCLIENEQKSADLSSRKDLIKNTDGSVDLYFGPKSPVEKEKNWIQTVPGQHWFCYFRFYGPTEKYFDRSWKMDDIKLMKN